MKKSTQELLDILKNTPAFSNYAEQEEAELIEVSLSDYLNRLIQAKNQDLPSLIRKSGLDRTYCYQIFDGRKRPSRDKVLALCFAMDLSFMEVQQLLKLLAIRFSMPVWSGTVRLFSACKETVLFPMPMSCSMN